MFGGGGQRPEPIAQLLAQRCNLAQAGSTRQAAVEAELRFLIRHVVVRQVSRPVHRYIGRRSVGLNGTLERPHRLVQPPHVEVEADGVRVARLLPTQKVTCSPQLQVPEGDPVARSQLGVVLQHLQSPLLVGVDHVGRQEIAVCATVAAADTAPQLVQLGESELLSVVHDHRVGIGDVEPRLHDHGGDENVHLPLHEAAHHIVQVALAHLSVRHRRSGPRREPAHALADRLDRLDTVMYEEHLPAPVQLPGDRLLEQLIVPRLDEGEHRRAVPGWGLDQREITESSQREMQRPGDRRGSERQNVHFQAQRLETLFVSHTEPVLLVHHHQAEIAERDVAREKTMGPDDNVDRATAELLQHTLLLRRGPEP